MLRHVVVGPQINRGGGLLSKTMGGGSGAGGGEVAMPRISRQYPRTRLTSKLMVPTVKIYQGVL